ncbi:MAG: hypothetical protein HQL25_01755 [Candidatus Omnitrophica bacterium]|nr:hypothetical protein [Candidatus Omnitrophota bacterium]
MKKMITQFIVSSPGELREALAKVNPKNEARFASVRVFGPMVFTRHFEHSKVFNTNSLAALKIDAAQALSMAPHDVEAAYQFLNTEGDNFKGVFTAMPSVYLADYLDAFKDSHLVPVSITSVAAGMVEDKLNNSTAACKDYCIINFLNPKCLSIVIFLGGKPVFFREMYISTDNEIEEGVADTIRYCCGRNTIKQIEDIICIGNTDDSKAALIQKIKIKILSAQKTTENTEETKNGQPALKFTAPNLFNKYALNFTERSKLCHFMTWGLILCVIIGLWGVVRLVDNYQKFKIAEAVYVK